MKFTRLDCINDGFFCNFTRLEAWELTGITISKRDNSPLVICIQIPCLVLMVENCFLPPLIKKYCKSSVIIFWSIQFFTSLRSIYYFGVKYQNPPCGLTNVHLTSLWFGNLQFNSLSFQLKWKWPLFSPWKQKFLSMFYQEVLVKTSVTSDPRALPIANPKEDKPPTRKAAFFLAE